MVINASLFNYEDSIETMFRLQDVDYTPQILLYDHHYFVLFSSIEKNDVVEAEYKLSTFLDCRNVNIKHTSKFQRI